MTIQGEEAEGRGGGGEVENREELVEVRHSVKEAIHWSYTPDYTQ